MLEVERPKRRQSSTKLTAQRQAPNHAEAEAAARIVLAGEAAGVPKKSGDGCVEMIRVLRRQFAARL